LCGNLKPLHTRNAAKIVAEGGRGNRDSSRKWEVAPVDTTAEGDEPVVVDGLCGIVSAA
jgi:hypothetical protein